MGLGECNYNVAIYSTMDCFVTCKLLSTFKSVNYINTVSEQKFLQ